MVRGGYKTINYACCMGLGAEGGAADGACGCGLGGAGVCGIGNGGRWGPVEIAGCDP